MNVTDEPRFEHDAPTPEEAEETRKAWQEEQADSLDVLAEGTAAEGHAQEAADLGFSLLWWKDKSFYDAHVAMGNLFDQVLASVDDTKALRAVGLPEDTMAVQITVGQVSGPLVMAGLQVFSLYLPELREDIKAALASIPVPTATPEETEAINAAYAALEERAQAMLGGLLSGFIGEDAPEDDDEEANTGPGWDGSQLN